jgi:DnaJ-class molecular chaperone
VEISSLPNEVIQPFAWKIVKNEGMPKRDFYSEFGDLHVKMNIAFPKTLSEEQKKIINMILPE